MSLDTGLSTRLFESQVLKSDGPLFVFERFRELEIKCINIRDNKTMDPVDCYRHDPSETFFDLSAWSHTFTMALDAEAGSVYLLVGLDYRESSKNDDAVQKLSHFAELLFAAGQFVFACTDIAGDPPPKISEEIKVGNVKWIFWENYFGPSLVKKFGRDFLLNAPGFYSGDTAFGGIKYHTKKLPTERHNTRLSKEIVSYFSKKMAVKLYRSEQFLVV